MENNNRRGVPNTSSHRRKHPANGNRRYPPHQGPASRRPARPGGAPAPHATTTTTTTTTGSTATPATAGHIGHGPRPRRFSGQRRRGVGPARAKNQNFDQLFQQYLNLWENYLLARKKYFEGFQSPGNVKKKRLEAQFSEGCQAIRMFEARLPNEYMLAFQARIGTHPEEQTYALNHALQQPDGKNSAPPEIPTGPADFHTTAEQKSRKSYRDDNLETQGTLEDYYALKKGRSGS